MKKIIIFSLLSVLLLFILTGCGNNEGALNREVSINNSNEFTVENTSFVFNVDSSFHDFIYKNAEGLEPDESKYACYLTYENKEIYNGRFVFRIVMDFQENKTLNDVTDLPKDLKNKNINNISWKTYTSNNDKASTIVFVTEKNNNLYVVNVMKYKDANVDINSLSNVFMNGLVLK